MSKKDDEEIKRFLRSEVDQAALVAASDFHNIDDIVTIRELRAEVLTLRERVAFLESPEVCAAAHDDVSECGYCQRDRLRARVAELEALLCIAICGRHFEGASEKTRWFYDVQEAYIAKHGGLTALSDRTADTREAFMKGPEHGA